MENQSIIDKIRKLQALADNAGTEHEAALASERVAELCRAHNLEIGVATLIEEEKEASEFRHEHAGRYQAHWSALSEACARVFNVGRYRKPIGIVIKDAHGRVAGAKDGNAMIFFGLKSNVQAATETYEYLLATVEALLEGHIRTGGDLRGQSDFRSFRIGCGMRIYKEATKIQEASKLLRESSEESVALVRLENRLVKAHEAKLKLKTGRSAGAASTSAYVAGFAAGGNVDFHGARSSRMLR